MHDQNVGHSEYPAEGSRGCFRAGEDHGGLDLVDAVLQEFVLEAS